MWKNYNVNFVPVWTYNDGPIEIQVCREHGKYYYSCILLGIVNKEHDADNDTFALRQIVDLCIAKAAELIDILRLAKERIVAQP